MLIIIQESESRPGYATLATINTALAHTSFVAPSTSLVAPLTSDILHPTSTFDTHLDTTAMYPKVDVNHVIHHIFEEVLKAVEQLQVL